MKASTQVVGHLAIVAALFAVPLLPMEPRTHALVAALVITIGGGTMAFLRSRGSAR